MNKVLVRSIAGLAFLLLVLALILFLSAGSIVFWQAWVYLGGFGICTLLVTAYLFKYDQKLLESRVKAGPIAETQKSQKIIQSLASLFFIGLYIVSGCDYRFHWSEVPAFVSLISEGFVALGFFIVFLVFRENSFAGAVIQLSDEQKVIATGPYGVIRHPMYSGALLLIVCTPPALGSWPALLCALPMIVVIAVRAIDEEKYLSENLPGYTEYCRKVHYRLLPFIW